MRNPLFVFYFTLDEDGMAYGDVCAMVVDGEKRLDSQLPEHIDQVFAVWTDSYDKAWHTYRSVEGSN